MDHGYSIQSSAAIPYAVYSKIGYYCNNWAFCFDVIVSLTWRPYYAVQTLSYFLCFAYNSLL